MLAGAAFGRILPALLVSITGAALLLFGLPTLALLPQSPAIYASGHPLTPGAISEGEGWRDANGTILSWAAGQANVPAGLDYDAQEDWLNTHYKAVELEIPGAREPMVIVTEAALAGAIALVAFGATALVVVRRRPY